MADKSFVDMENARLEEQKQVMQNISDVGHCPFCPENLALYHKEPTLKIGKYWILTKNQWPYEHTDIHLLAIYTKHAEKLSDVSPEAGKELLEFFQWAEKEYGVPGGALCMRFGDTRYSAGTVKHIHAQFIKPSLTGAVKFPIAKDPK